MKRSSLLLFAGLLLQGSILVLLPALARAQNEPSLGEIARQARRQKPAPAPGERVYDNENLPGKAVINTVGSADAAKPADQSPANGQASSDDANKDKNATLSAEDHKKANEEWAGKIGQQKEEISRLERELNVLQRESQIHAAVNYADVGSRLANNAKFAEQDRQYQEQIAAKQKLADMQEEARKAGVPASSRD